MMRLILGVALVALTAPLAAQNSPPTSPATQPGSQDDPGTPREPLANDRGYDKPQARTEAINAPNRGDVAAANSMTSGASVNSGAVQADLQAQYDTDMTAWLDAMHRRDNRIAANDARYDRQRRAYADAMYVWRMQVRDCERGYQFACNRPTPNPADFMR